MITEVGLLVAVQTTKRAGSGEVDPATASGIGAVLLGLVCIGILIHFTPTTIAICRGHPNMLAIIVLNLLAGWTFVGWVVAMVWACSAIEKRRYAPNI